MTTTDDKTSAHKIMALKYGTWGDTRHFLDRAADIAAAGEAALRAEIEALRKEAVLKKAECDGLGSLLLSVQQDCIAEAGRANRAEADRDRLAADLAVAREALELALDDLDEWVACKDSLVAAGFNMDDTAERADFVRAALARITEADNA